ncbi:hypothetical protein GCM10009665_53460 [Kitasatospora nipponensis]|uniref:Uncharacterized protein n=1 Tax=Kitasatospora nipponensis TaxID=258049 RepID=A0ABP4HD65_9ACTN
MACWTAGRAGAISDWSIEKTPAPVARTAKVSRLEVRGIRVPLWERVAAGQGRPRSDPARVSAARRLDW